MQQDLHKRFTRDVVLHVVLGGLGASGQALGLKPLECGVVRTARLLVDPAPTDALLQDRVRHRQRNHAVDLLALSRQHGIERLGLGHCAGEPVENEALGALGLLDLIADNADDDVVRDKRTRGHQVLGLLADFGTGGHSRPEHVACGELRRAAALDDLGRMRALACARGAEEDDDGALFLAEGPPRALRRCRGRRELRLRKHLAVLCSKRRAGQDRAQRKDGRPHAAHDGSSRQAGTRRPGGQGLARGAESTRREMMRRGARRGEPDDARQ